jgi:hypothetical protein
MWGLVENPPGDSRMQNGKGKMISAVRSFPFSIVILHFAVILHGGGPGAPVAQQKGPPVFRQPDVYTSFP